MQREWFSVSSNKLATVVQVETMLTSIRDVSQVLLEHVVNMADNNVTSSSCWRSVCLSCHTHTHTHSQVVSDVSYEWMTDFLATTS